MKAAMFNRYNKKVNVCPILYYLLYSSKWLFIAATRADFQVIPYGIQP